MGVSILGISAYRHDSAAALVRDGEIVAAAQEERFTRKKFDARFPWHAARWCLAKAGLPLTAVDYVAVHDTWVRHSMLYRDVQALAAASTGDSCNGGPAPPPLSCPHHRSHAASAFLPSPFRRAAVLCVDGVGQSSTTSLWSGEDNRLTPQWEIGFPHSLGLLYSAFTHYCGFKINSGEHKLMGLAPYGEPRYVEPILQRLIDVDHDGAFRLNMAYFDVDGGPPRTNERFRTLFGGPEREPETPLSEGHLDLARSIQAVTEEVVLKLARTARRLTGAESLCLAGGVALNCVAMGRLLREGPFENIWIQPAAGEAGGALGAALSIWYETLGNARRRENGSDAMQGAYLGPSYDDAATEAALAGEAAVWERLGDAELFSRVARLLADGRVVGWMQGRMEFGPRVLGARSILGDPRSPKMQSLMNLKIKRRESFRPFAPAVLAERARAYFQHDRPSPYMLFTAPVAGQIRLPLKAEQQALSGLRKLTVPRSTLPAVTHVDYSARLQTAHRETNPRFHRLLEAFERRTGCAVLVNTSFTVRGEPIVCSPEDAYRCFMGTDIEYLCVGNCVL
ncbi:MAG: carbamoyltransferase, partial [Bacteroidota bacterium]